MSEKSSAIGVINPGLGAKKPWFRKYIRDYWQIYLLLIPAVVYFIIFHYGPMYGVQIAFRNYRPRYGIWNSEWVGLKHFRRFLNDPWFFILLRNTLLLSFYSLIAGFPIPLILAFMINEVRNKKFQKTVQMITYAPHFLSGVVVAGMISLFFRLDTGIVNILIERFGGQQQDWLSSQSAFKHLYVWSGVWQGAGWGTIIYLASLASVDQEVIEASIIDGATKLQRIRYIDFPTIKPTIVINLLLSLGGILGSNSEKIILLQRDITKMVSETFGSYMYNQGIQQGNFDYTTAAGMFQSIVNLLLLSTFNFIARKVGETALW
jgi:putative aldouronate transport system permease protein